MELSPKTYHYLVRPEWFIQYCNNILLDHFNFYEKKVLDFGCGVGSSCQIFNPATYYGVDIDSKRIQYAQKLYPEYNFIYIKGTDLPLSDNLVDYILLNSVVHHLSDNSITEYMQEFKKILKPLGKIIVLEPCLFSRNRFNNFFMRSVDKGKYIRNDCQYFKMFEENGFKTELLCRFRQLLFYNKILFYANRT